MTLSRILLSWVRLRQARRLEKRAERALFKCVRLERKADAMRTTECRLWGIERPGVAMVAIPSGPVPSINGERSTTNPLTL